MVYRQVAGYRILIPQVLHGTAVAIYSIILYHGERPWEIPLQHIDLLDPATRSEVSALYDARDRHCLVFNLNAPEGSSQRIEIEGFSKELTGCICFLRKRTSLSVCANGIVSRPRP